MPTVKLKTAGGRVGQGFSHDHAAPLWVLIALELLAMSYLRNSFRRHHGG